MMISTGRLLTIILAGSSCSFSSGQRDSGLSVGTRLPGGDEHHRAIFYQQNSAQMRLQSGFRSELKLT